MIQELSILALKARLAKVARKPFEVNQSFFGGLTVVCYAEDTEAMIEFFRANCIVQKIETGEEVCYAPPVPIGDAVVYFRHLFALGVDSREDGRTRSMLMYRACIRNGIYQAKSDNGQGQGQGQPDWAGPPPEFFI